MYTASLYGCLASLLSTVEPAELLNKRFSLFSFGSGCASTFWTARVKGDTSDIRQKLNLKERLAAMTVAPPTEFVAALALREKNHNSVNYTPEGSVDNIWPGAYYLESVDSKYRRKYVDVVFPSNERLENALNKLETIYAKGKARISDVLSRAGDGKLEYAYLVSMVTASLDSPTPTSSTSDLLVLSPKPDASSDVWCADPRGVLTLSVCKETYEDLGITGHALPFKGHSDRHVIQIALRPGDVGANSTEGSAKTKTALAQQKARIEQWEERRKVRDGLNGWDVVWCSNSIAQDGYRIPDLETGGESGAHSRRVRPTKNTLRNVYIPTNSTICSPRPNVDQRKGDKRVKAQAEEALEDWGEGIWGVLEWVGMAILGAPRLQENDRVNPFVAVYEPPSPSRIGDVTHLSWKGFLSPTFVQSIIDAVCSILDSDRSDASFAAITVHGIPTTPVGYLPTSGGSVPARLPREDGEDTATLLLGRGPSFEKEELGYVMTESIGQWDTRWG
ncbi:hypothetical protein NMY22_g9053 [Coprinellus aureogranulatus]|nr:hypothetical protein NMY22_g9053 [Coprinellus aureogranulatus]